MVCTVSLSFYFNVFTTFAPKPQENSFNPLQRFGEGKKEPNTSGKCPMFVSSTTWWVQALRSDLAELSQPLQAGRSQETPLPPPPPLWGAPSPTTRHFPTVLVFSQHSALLGARLWPRGPGTARLPGDRKEAMGLTSTMGKVLVGDGWLWRSAGCPRESSGGCGWRGLCSEEQAGG